MPIEVIGLRVGYCRAPERASRRDGRLAPITFPAGVGLIRHPSFGDILIDCGYGAAFWEATAPFPERLYRLTTPATLPEPERLQTQLDQLDAKPRAVLFTHLHADHSAGYFDLSTRPQIHVSRLAWESLKSQSRLQRLKAGCPDKLAQNLLALPDPKFFEEQLKLPTSFAGIPHGYDILGDQSLIALPLPGHGHGQFGIFIPNSTSGPHLFLADAAWSRRALRDNVLPPSLVLSRLGNAAAYRESFTALRSLMTARPDITLWPSHCPEAFPDRSAK